MAGREPRGTVDPRDLEEVCDRLADHLLDVVNVDTGEPLVDAVLRTSDHYDRAEVDNLPDLGVELAEVDGRPVPELSSSDQSPVHVGPTR